MAKAGRTQDVVISAPRMQTAEFGIRGTTPLVLHKFSKRKKDEIHAKHVAGSTGRKGTKKEARDFQREYEEAKFRCDGWLGINANAFREAMVTACGLCGFFKTTGKLTVFIEPDGFDVEAFVPLVKITKGEPQYFEAEVRNATGVMDLRARPLWAPGWEAKVRVRYDADQMTLNDVTNLLMRVGVQVGIGEGRPDSKKSCGQGWGLFELKGKPHGQE